MQQSIFKSRRRKFWQAWQAEAEPVETDKLASSRSEREAVARCPRCRWRGVIATRRRRLPSRRCFPAHCQLPLTAARSAAKPRQQAQNGGRCPLIDWVGGSGEDLYPTNSGIAETIVTSFNHEKAGFTRRTY